MPYISNLINNLSTKIIYRTFLVQLNNLLVAYDNNSGGALAISIVHGSVMHLSLYKIWLIHISHPLLSSVYYLSISCGMKKKKQVAHPHSTSSTFFHNQKFYAVCVSCLERKHFMFENFMSRADI